MFSQEDDVVALYLEHFVNTKEARERQRVRQSKQASCTASTPVAVVLGLLCAGGVVLHVPVFGPVVEVIHPFQGFLQPSARVQAALYHLQNE